MLEITKLKNGIHIVSESAKHLQSAAVGVWVGAGSRNENTSQQGLSHVLEHMAFKGTHKRTAQDIVCEIENVGGDINAETGFETTAYYARLLKKDVPLAIDIFADILSNSLFDDGELEREKHVILQEIGAAKDDPQDFIYDNFQQTAFANQPIAHSIMGSVESVKNFQTNDLHRYLISHYQGNNMVLAVVGDIKHKQIVKQAENAFANIANKKTTTTKKAKYIGGEKRIKKKLQETQILIGFEGRGFHAPEFYASQILAVLMGGGMASRLFQTIREKHGLCYSIYSSHTAYKDTGLFYIYASTEKNDVKQLMQLLMTELKKASEKITKEEVVRAREQIRAAMILAQENPISRAAQIAKQMLIFNRHINNEEIMQRLDNITHKKIQTLAEKLFRKSKPTLASMGATDKMITRQQFINEMQK